MKISVKLSLGGAVAVKNSRFISDLLRWVASCRGPSSSVRVTSRPAGPVVLPCGLNKHLHSAAAAGEEQVPEYF